jgi:hypothetical protein
MSVLSCCMCIRIYLHIKLQFRWSPRLFDSIMTGSIPIIYADGTMLPFEHWIDYRQFTIKIMNTDVGKTEDILTHVSKSMDTLTARRKMMEVRNRFVWNLVPDVGEDDAFGMCIKELERKRRRKLVGPFSYPNPLK